MQTEKAVKGSLCAFNAIAQQLLYLSYSGEGIE